MPELSEILLAKREQENRTNKFLAALQGVDLDNAYQGKDTTNAWEDLQTKVFTKGKVTNSKDIVGLQGRMAQRAGFGIGMGLDYSDSKTQGSFW